jgi:hypothetical protein
MSEIKFDDIECRYKDDIQIAFSVVDRNGAAVTVAGGTATFRIARRGSAAQVIEYTETDGITLSGSTATVAFNSVDLDAAGDYVGQLRITKSGLSMVSSEGEIKVLPLIE